MPRSVPRPSWRARSIPTSTSRRSQRSRRRSRSSSPAGKTPERRRAPESSSRWSRNCCGLRGRRGQGSPSAPTEARDSEEIRVMLLAAVEKHEPMEIEYDGFQGVTRRVDRAVELRRTILDRVLPVATGPARVQHRADPLGEARIVALASSRRARRAPPPAVPARRSARSARLRRVPPP